MTQPVKTPETLSDKLEKDYIVAYKGKDGVCLSVLRLLKTALKNFQVEHMRAPTDDDILTVIARQCKQRQDSIEQYTNVGRPELAEKEAAEMNVLLAYMPPRLEGAELEAAIAVAMTESGACGLKDMGKVMQALMAGNKGRVDGKAASDAVKSALMAAASK